MTPASVPAPDAKGGRAGNPYAPDLIDEAIRDDREGSSQTPGPVSETTPVATLSIPVPATAKAPAGPKRGFTRRHFIGLTLSALAGVAIERVRRSRIATVNADSLLLDDLQRRASAFFLESSYPGTGLILDRANITGADYAIGEAPAASIAVTGFGLASLCIGAERGCFSRSDAADKIRTSLEFLATKAPHERGWFYHWMDPRTGARAGALQGSWDLSEVSTIDTALLLAGALTARAYFGADAAIRELVDTLYRRIDFMWMLNPSTGLLCHGWTPEKGMIPYYWDEYAEASVLYLLAIGSPTMPIPAKSWYAWMRRENQYAEYHFIGRAPLFTHQYSHAFVDFRGIRDLAIPGGDWFTNSVTATRAHRQFCWDLKERFPTYSENIWGIVPSRSAAGYTDWGGPPLDPRIDGTVVPSAVTGSLMFTPDICLPAIAALKEAGGAKAFDRFGFADAFNPRTGWASTDATGLGLGITLLSAENLRSGKVWEWFMGAPEIQKAVSAVKAGGPILQA